MNVVFSFWVIINLKDIWNVDVHVRKQEGYENITKEICAEQIAYYFRFHPAPYLHCTDVGWYLERTREWGVQFGSDLHFECWCKVICKKTFLLKWATVVIKQQWVDIHKIFRDHPRSTDITPGPSLSYKVWKFRETCKNGWAWSRVKMATRQYLGNQ